MRAPGTSEYAQGVEVPLEYDGEIPEGFDCMELPDCKMMVFQGTPYQDEDFMDAVEIVWKQLETFRPGTLWLSVCARGCTPFPACADGVPWLY